jgi:hypothetical protein
MREPTRWTDVVAVLVASVAGWSAIAQQSVTAWTLVLVVGALILLAYPRLRQRPIEGRGDPKVVADASKNSGICLACSGIALVVALGFLFLMYVGLARCIPFGLGGDQSC